MINEPTKRSSELSEREKRLVREHLAEFVRAHPARVPLPLRLLDFLEWSVYSPRLQFALAAIGLVFIAGSGTAFAARSALPGDPLYGIKVNVEEPIQGAFATSAQAKADWNAQLAATRLSEAEQLAAQNKLTPSAVSTISSGLDQAAENFDANVAQFATTSGDVATAATLESTMEVTLAANTQAMTEIASAVPSAQSALAPIISNAQQRTISANNTRARFDIAATQANITQVKAAAEAQLDAAEGQLSGVSTDVNSTTSIAAAPQAQAAAAAIQVGQANLDQGNYVAALETLQAAALEAGEAQVDASVGEQLQSAGDSSASATTTSSALSATSTFDVSTSSVTTSLPSATTSTSTYHRRHP